jgi:hypothetical protein
MATEVGSLTLKVDTTGVKKGKADLDKFSQSAAAVEEAIEDIEEAAKGAIPPLEKLPEAVGGAIPPGLPPAANDAGDRIGGLGRKAGMAGIQFEQLAGQIAAGQNPMRAVGVQAADLGFVLGVPLLGAIVGIGAAVGSVLIPAMMGAEKSADDLEESLTDIGKIMSEDAATGAMKLSDSFLRLAKTSRNLAEIELRVKYVEALQNATAAQQLMIDSLDELSVTHLTAGGMARGNETRLKAYAEQMGISTEQANNLRLAIDSMAAGNEGAAASVTAMVNELLQVDGVTDKFAQMALPVLQAAMTMQTAEEQAEFLSKALADIPGAIQDASESSSEYANSAQGMIAAMEEEAATAGLTGRALAILSVVRQAEAEGFAPEKIAALAQRAGALYDEAQAAEAATAAIENKAKAEAKDESKKAAEAAKTLEMIMALNDTEIEALERKETRQLEILNERLEAGKLAQEEYEAAVTEIAEHGAARRAEISEKEAADRGQGSLELTDALINMENLLFDAKDKKSKAALRVAVNLASAEKRENAKKIMSDAYTAAMSAYKSLAGIPFIGPALGAAAAAAILATGAQYATQSLTGRALGGQVRPGESYMVGERGPEILTMGNGGGSITPNEAIRNENSQTVNKTANVSFNISANDTQGFDELLVQRRGVIISVINEALNDQGRPSLA